MKLRITDLVAAALVAVLIANWKLEIENFQFPIDPLAKPPAALQKLVAPIGDLLRGQPAAAEFAAWCVATAEILDRDRGAVVKTAETLQRYNAAVVRFRFADHWKPVPGLADAMNAAMVGWVGSKAGPIDAARIAKAAECYRACAWAVNREARGERRETRKSNSPLVSRPSSLAPSP
jgi:hypothetical protein